MKPLRVRGETNDCTLSGVGPSDACVCCSAGSSAELQVSGALSLAVSVRGCAGCADGRVTPTSTPFWIRTLPLVKEFSRCLKGSQSLDFGKY